MADARCRAEVCSRSGAPSSGCSQGGYESRPALTPQRRDAVAHWLASLPHPNRFTYALALNAPLCSFMIPAAPNGHRDGFHAALAKRVQRVKGLDTRR
jgi:hypothetical protein